MKTLRFLVLGLLAMAVSGRAQDSVSTNGGWLPIGVYDYQTTASDVSDTNQPIVHANLISGPAAIAEVVTPEIQALADGLQDDPLKIYNYVHDHIRYVLYFGSKKGAALTLLEKSGNDFDQCALLVALLRAAGYSNAGYQFGWMPVPFDNPDGSHRDIHHWFGLNFTNNNWSTTLNYLNNLLEFWRGYPFTTGNYSGTLGNNIFAFQRVWVTVTIGGTNYLLDPAFKVTEPIAGISLAAAMGSDPASISNALMTAAGGSDVGTFTSNFYTTNLNEAAIRGALTGYTTNLLNYIQSNYPNASVEQILSGSYIVPSTNTALSQNLLFSPVNMNGTMPVTNWVNEPTNIMSTLTLQFAGTSYKWFMPQLQGQRLALTYAASTAQLWQDDTLLASGTFNVADGVTLTASHPHGGLWNITNNQYIPGNYVAQKAATYTANANYAILYCFEPDWGWLQQRQKKLEAYRQQGLADTSRQVVTETLNVMGMNWQMQVEYLSRTLAAQIGVLPMNYQRMGRMGQESGKGYYVDIYLNTEGSASSTGLSCDYTCDPNHGEWFDLYAYFSSGMEHGMIEQLQSTNLIAASSIKMLEIANTNHQAVYLASSTNWSAVQTKLTNYTIADLTGLINSGYILLLPQNGANSPSGPGGRTFFGFLAKLGNGGGTQMLIGPGIFGGYSGSLSATVDYSFVNYSGFSQPYFYNSSPVSLPSLTGADPVNMADGTFQVQATDLSVGDTEPRGLSFSHYYSSSRRNSHLAGMAPGWLHNYYMNAATVSSPQAGLGGTTPAQMATMLVATEAAISIYNRAQPDPKNWLTTALIAKWGIDQLTAKAVSVSLGQDTIQFIKQPDGSFTPPANSTMMLTQATNGAYTLQERHGRTFTFDKSGWATNIADQYGKSLTLAYNASNWVTTATDWKGRALTFNYSTTSPKRLISVADGGGRSIALGYSTGGDLISVTDPESKTNRFLYDTNHQITANFDALNQLVASNIYNSFGRVTTQFTQGDTNKTWRIFWSGWQTVSQDPAGGKQSYFYDDKTRVIAQQDQLGNVSRSVFDGQDHVIASVSPLNETNQFIFDGNHNVVQVIDPLGFSNQFIYDGQNNLTKALDALGNPTTFGYNSKFQMTGQTNGAGDWISFGFDSDDGALTSRTDEGGATTYGYDTIYRRLNNVAYPNGLGSESFANSYFGDVTNHTDARGFSTAYQYNARRQLTNTIAPTNLTVKVTYDAVGNQLATTDARGLTYSNTWGPTRRLVAAKFPTTASGAASITNIYDSRDWLVKTLDSYQQPVLYSNDLAGRLVSQTDPLQRTTAFGFDANGKTIATTNAEQEITRQTWDARGKPIQQVDGAQHLSFAFFDPAGNQTVLTNRNGKTWHFQFDGANRVTATTTPLNRQRTQTYNHLGLPATVTDPANQTTILFYDSKHRLTNRTDNLGAIFYSYDANDNGTNVIENGKTNSWAYDAYNRVSTYQDANGFLLQYRYDLNGNLTNLIYPGNKVVAYFYDSLNRLTNVTDWSQRKTVITYDLAGRITGLVRPNGTYQTDNYDAAGEVTNILDQMANTLPIAWFKFNWTNNGSLGWEFSAPLPHVSTAPTRTMTYDDDNQMLTVNNQAVNADANGNLTNAPLPNGNFASLTFDARNRLLITGGVTNTYDALNNRIGQKSGTNSSVFVVNPNASLPQTLMRIKNGVTNYYIYGAGLIYQITETATATNTRSYHFDYRGSTVAITDDSGNATDRIEYSAYGLTTYSRKTTDTPFLFNGKYGVMTDTNGLLYMRARYYNPYLCRFMSADPSGFGGGLNEYAYASGNPVALVDPFGLGAMESSVDLSWFNAPTAGEQAFHQFLTDFANLATFGLANDVARVTSGLADDHGIGHDLYGNVATRQDQYLSGAMLAAAVIPFGALESSSSRVATRVGEGITADTRMITVLGSSSDVAPYANRPGFNVLNMNNLPKSEWPRQNALWLNQAIRRGDTIWLVTDPVANSARLTAKYGTDLGSYYHSLELPFLEQYSGINVVPRHLTTH